MSKFWLIARRILFVSVLFAGSCTLVDWRLPQYRYRLTVALETPEGIKSASSVIEIELPSLSNQCPPELCGSPGWIRGGTAPILDLGPRGTLVACLRSDSNHRQDYRHSLNAIRLVIAAYAIDLRWPHASAFRRMWGRKLEDMNPLLVWLPPGANRPDQAKAISPAEIEATMGSGVRLASIRIAPTSAHYSTRVEPAPDWLWAMRDRYNEMYSRGPAYFDFHANAVETERVQRRKPTSQK